MISTPSGVDVLVGSEGQQQLFSPNNPPRFTRNGTAYTEQETSKRQRLSALLEGELNFHGEDSGYASHDVHAFAAKFPPQLPRAFIHGLTAPGDVVLDPMMGSGTTIVEALLTGRKGIGFDIDPLALRLSHAKTVPMDVDELRSISLGVMSQAQDLLFSTNIDEKLAESFDTHTKEFVNYWFLPNTQRELMALIAVIQSVKEPLARRFLELTFSSVIVTKSGGVSRARDLAHSRPHLDKDKIPKNALEQFSVRLQKNLKSIAHITAHDSLAAPLAGDARLMPLRSETIDLIVTSPPYANAIDYMRAHKFPLVWLGNSVVNLTNLRAQYIGSEKNNIAQYAELPNSVTTTILQLEQHDRKKSYVLRKYFSEMKSVLIEMYRVLRQNSPAIIVVGTSIMRGINVQTHKHLANIANEIGFQVVGIAQRMLDRNKRMMPARFGKKTDSMIEQRMHEEYVIGLLKS